MNMICVFGGDLKRIVRGDHVRLQPELRMLGMVSRQNILTCQDVGGSYQDVNIPHMASFYTNTPNFAVTNQDFSTKQQKAFVKQLTNTRKNTNANPPVPL